MRSASQNSLSLIHICKLMETAIKLGKPVNPNLHVGICGEHGGDPSSVEFCHKIGLDYVSCSPFRVPIARLAAAQAAIAQKWVIEKAWFYAALRAISLWLFEIQKTVLRTIWFLKRSFFIFSIKFWKTFQENYKKKVGAFTNWYGKRKVNVLASLWR